MPERMTLEELRAQLTQDDKELSKKMLDDDDSALDALARAFSRDSSPTSGKKSTD